MQKAQESFVSALLPSARRHVTASIVARTDVGRVRSHNEDAIVFADLTTGKDDPSLVGRIGAAGLVLGVCDGMGGAAAGEVASCIAAREISANLVKLPLDASRDGLASALVQAIEGAGEKIKENALAHPSRKGMGTTCTAAVFRHGELFIGQVGDSRAYVCRLGTLTQLTKDQSFIGKMVELGHLTEEDAKDAKGGNLILQALGSTKDIRVDVTNTAVRRGDRLLICSDGLSGFVPDDLMCEVLSTERDPVRACERLVALANEAGGRDNITAVLCEFDGEGLPPTNAEDTLGYQTYSPEDASSVIATALAKPKPEDSVVSPAISWRRSIVFIAALLVAMGVAGSVRSILISGALVGEGTTRGAGRALPPSLPSASPRERTSAEPVRDKLRTSDDAGAVALMPSAAPLEVLVPSGAEHALPDTSGVSPRVKPEGSPRMRHRPTPAAASPTGTDGPKPKPWSSPAGNQADPFR